MKKENEQDMLWYHNITFDVKPHEVLPEGCKTAIGFKLFALGIGIILYSILLLYIGGRLS